MNQYLKDQLQFLNRVSEQTVNEKASRTHKGCSQSKVQTATSTMYVNTRNKLCVCTHMCTHINTTLPHNYCFHCSICPNWKLVHQGPSQRNPCQVPESINVLPHICFMDKAFHMTCCHWMLMFFAFLAQFISLKDSAIFKCSTAHGNLFPGHHIPNTLTSSL